MTISREDCDTIAGKDGVVTSQHIGLFCIAHMDTADKFCRKVVFKEQLLPAEHGLLQLCLI